MNDSLTAIQDWTSVMVQQYGYHAVVPVLLADPAGVPWYWIFLILLAAKSSLNVPAMLLYGFVILSLADHALYWIGVTGGRPLVRRVGNRWPQIQLGMEKSEELLRGRGIWALVLGRFLPLVGRWIGVGAGLANVSYWRFIVYDAVGVLITTVGFGACAHLAGKQMVNSPYFNLIVLSVFIVSTLLTGGACAWLARRFRPRRSTPASG